jgi:hypothetical protein
VREPPRISRVPPIWGRLQGIITDRDIVVRCLAWGRNTKTTTAGGLAQGKPVWVDADADDSEVLRLMEEHQIRRLPVIGEHRLVGMISEADLATHLPQAKIAEFAYRVYSAPPSLCAPPLGPVRWTRDQRRHPQFTAAGRTVRGS